MFKSGYVAVVGRPNVGKSTLINAILGEKLMAVSAKPQTTRHRILGIKNLLGGQLLFLDTPGMHRPHKALNDSMVRGAHAAVEEADLFLFVVEADQRHDAEDEEIHKLIARGHKPILLVINKADKVYKPQLLPLMEEMIRRYRPQQVVPVSALKNHNLEPLEREILKYLPEGPPLFPDDQLSDRTDRFFAAEVIREKIMECTRKEVPYSVAVLIEAYEEREAQRDPGVCDPRVRDPKVYIRAAIIVEKDSQKGILIGAKGQMIKKIGQLAREELEQRLDRALFLELFVRVEAHWTQDPRKVAEFTELS